MSEKLEAGEIPEIPFANDGSFFEQFLRQQQASEAQQHVDSNVEKAGTAEEVSEPSKADQEQKTTTATPSVETGPTTVTNLDLSKPLLTATTLHEKPTDPPTVKGNPIEPKTGGSKPHVVLKAKRPIVVVLTRSGEPNKRDSKKKKKVDTESGSGSKSFYLREMEKYRQQACDGGSSERPLVK